jgi:hypothetical protein
MRIGISVITHAGQSIWENGLGQNVVFLARLLRSLPMVQEVLLLNCGDQPALPPGACEVLRDFRLIPPREATDLIDVAIEMGGGLDIEWLDYIRALGKRVVFHCAGQPYVALVEPAIFGVAGYFSRVDRCDEIWLLPKDMRLAPMLRTLHRCPVWEVPYLWDATFITQRSAEVASVGLHFGYVPRADGSDTTRGFRLAIFEPNISVVKACSIPLLICDAAYRTKPASVKSLHVLNSEQMKDHPTFVYLVKSLDLYRESKITITSRHDFVGYMSQHVDAVISHQWQNIQNYLYLDALYGGYPLIHNSPWLAPVGYYYPEFDIACGAAQLIDACATHDANLGSYKQRVQSFLSRLDPVAPHNAQAYAHRLLALGPTRPHSATRSATW